MRYLLLSFILLFSFTACTDDSAQKEAKIKELTQITKTMETQREAEKNTLSEKIKLQEIALQKAQLEAKQAKEELLAQKKLHADMQKKKELAQTLSPKEEKLSKLGVTIEENKITLDTDKTKDFFESFAKELSMKLKKVTEELQDGSLIEKDAGIKFDESHINIDLNKTKDFLNEWGKKMQGFIKEFDDIAQELNIDLLEQTNTNQKGN